MKKFVFVLYLLNFFGAIVAQEYPSEWVKYTLGGYIYAIEYDINNDNLPEIDFKERVLNVARANLAKQIEMQVCDVATLNKESIDGHTSVAYSSQTNFSTDVNMVLVNTRTQYDTVERKGYAIAFIDKDAACSYYKNELNLLFGKMNNSRVLADDLISNGFKFKAREELSQSLKYLAEIEEPLFWMNIFGMSQLELTEWQNRFNETEQAVKQSLLALKHGVVICLSCEADIFGQPYTMLQSGLMGALSAEGCSFTDNPSEADWVITIVCNSREYNNVMIGKINTYFSYVDAQIAIDKTISAQRVFESGVSEKGGHVLNFTKAAEVAYKNLKQSLAQTIIDNIKQ